MNILILSQRVPYPPNKGEKIRTYFQIAYLVANGHRVSVCTPAHTDEDIQSIKSLSSKCNIPVIFEKIGHVLPRLIRGLLSFKAFSISYFYSNRLQKKLDQLIKKNDFDVVLCTSSSMAEYIYKSDGIRIGAGSSSKLGLLMDFMDLDSDKWKQYSVSATWIMKWVYAREARILAHFESKIQQTFDHCFFISQNEVDLFQKVSGDTQNVHVLGNGIDTDFFYPPDIEPENVNPVFIFTGVMDYKPNVVAVLWFIKNAWGFIREKYPEARFIIAGMNPVQDVRNLAATPGVEVTGFVKDILPVYQRADYFVAPFTIARGVQNKVLQAFACGLPVISSPMGAEGIDCRNGEHIIIATAGKDYLSAVNNLESDKALKKRIRENALQLIHEEYSWDRKLKVLDSFLGSPSDSNQ